MDLKKVLAELEIEAAFERMSPYWEQSQASLRAGLPRFLRPENIAKVRRQAHLPAEAEAQLCEAAYRIVATPALLCLAWHCNRLLFEHLDYEAGDIGKWPLLSGALGGLSGAFYLLVGLDAMPRIYAIHQERDIPSGISRDTCRHLLEPVRIYRDQNQGRFGVFPRALYWLRNHTKGDLYRLGRFEYMLRPFRGQLRAYRQRQSGAVVALAATESRFDAAGLVAQNDTPQSWQASLEEGAGQVKGFPIAPQGFAQNRRVTLSTAEWEVALCPGDPMLEVHIPAGGNMTLEHCQASMQQALEFFPRYFPDRSFSGFACSSWILNPQLEEIYRADSNMVQWQRQLYLFPTPSGDRSGLYFVFGMDELDIQTAPRDTSLRRALLDQLSKGGRLIGGGMFLLLEDFARFGSQVYRQSFEA